MSKRGHCDQALSRSSYYRHQRLYYNQESKQWFNTRITLNPQHSQSSSRRSTQPSLPDVSEPADTKALVNFGHVIGQDLVYIVSPLL